MEQKITMDMELRFIDNVTSESKSASKAVDQIGKEAKEAGQEIDKLGKKKAKPTIDADDTRVDRKLNKIDSALKKLGFRKTKTTIDADDRATAKITKALSKVKSWSGKKFNAFLELKDSDALRKMNKMSDGLKSLASKTVRVPIKILDYATKPLQVLKNTLFSIKGLVAAITAGLAAQQLVVKPISLADAYSSAQIGFSTLLGESQGQKMMDDLDAFAKATPFKASEVIAQTQRMLAMGWDAESIIDDMTTIGDAAAATGKGEQGLQQIVTALAQIKTKGKLSTEELNQLAEAGISAKKYIAEGLGYGTGDEGIAKMTKDLEDGAIASNKALGALLSGMQEYQGMMDKTANETVSGLWGQIEDTFEINIARRWGQGLQDGAKRSFGSIVDLIETADGALTKFGDTVYDVGKEISNWAADKLANAVQRVTEITDSYDFQNASTGEKVSMLWNGVVADPLREWWENGGRDKTAETAGEIGAWTGEMLTKGLLALFGATDVLDDGIGTEAGGNIAGSFLQGFLDNFDGSAITDAFVEAISNVWGALPAWAKIFLGVYGAGKVAGGIANLAGGISSFVGGVKNTVGSFSIASSAFPLLTSSGTGLAGLLGKAGVGLGASTAGSAILMGGLGIAGGLAGGATAISGGVDLYQAYNAHKDGNELERDANIVSGVSKLGGVGVGAGIGFALGGPLGALLGAGIGGIAGWFIGDQAADSIRATDDAINDVTASMQNLETEEEKIAEKNRLVWENMKEHMGDISLSMSEIQRLADQIVWGDDMGNFEQFSSAAKQAEASLQALKSAAEQTNRWMWKAGLGVTFNDDEIESIVASFDEYIASAKSYVENEHYEFTAAVSLLVDVESEGGKSILASGNAFYGKYQKALETAGKELGDLLTKSLADGFLNADEQDAITAAQQKIADITQKIADAETAAELELIKLKFSEGNLDLDSFDSFMAQMQSTLTERMEANDEAFKVAVSTLQLELHDGAITEEQYNEQLQTLIDGYTGKVDSIKADILGVELNIIGDAYSDVLGEDATAKLQAALQQSLTEGIDPIDWTPEQARRYLGIDSLSESSALAIAQMLGGVADQLELVTVNGKLMLNLGVEVPGDTQTKVETAVDQAVPGSVDENVDVNISPLPMINRLGLTGSDFGVQSSYSISPLINITARLGTVTPARVNESILYTKNYRGGIVGGSGTIPGYADGGMVRGGAQLITVAEEGSPEMIIPLSNQRRDRALKLWEKAGEIMKVPGFARGGRTDGGDEGIRFMRYGSGEASGGQTVQIDVGGVKVEIHVNADGSTNIVEAVKAQMGEITDAVVGAIADELGALFENTPVRGGVA